VAGEDRTTEQGTAGGERMRENRVEEGIGPEDRVQQEEKW
jgi:hypothetical protein